MKPRWSSHALVSLLVAACAAETAPGRPDQAAAAPEREAPEERVERVVLELDQFGDIAGPPPPLPPMGDALRFAAREFSEPDQLVPPCPPGPPCVGHGEATLHVYSEEWDYSWVIDWGWPHASIFVGMADEERGRQLVARRAAAVRAVAAAEGVEALQVHDGAVRALAALDAVSTSIVVRVPPTEAPSPPPEPVTAQEANDIVRNEYDAIDFPRGSPQLFSVKEVARREASTTEDLGVPRVDRFTAWTGRPARRVAEVVAVYGDEGSDVYVLARNSQDVRDMERWREQMESNLIEFLQSLRVERVRLRRSDAINLPRLAPSASSWQRIDLDGAGELASSETDN